MAGQPKRRARALLHQAIRARANPAQIRHIARVVSAQTARPNSGKKFGLRPIPFSDLIAGSDVRAGWLKELLESSPAYRAAPVGYQGSGRSRKGSVGVQATKADFESEFWVDLLDTSKGRSYTWKQWQEIAENTLAYTSKRFFAEFKKLTYSPFVSGVQADASGEDEFGRPGAEQHPGIEKSSMLDQPEIPGTAWLKRAQIGTTQKYLIQFLNRPPYAPGEDALQDTDDRKAAFILEFWFLYEQVAGDQESRVKELNERVQALLRDADEDEEDGYHVSADLSRREAQVLQGELNKYTKALKTLTDRMADARRRVHEIPGVDHHIFEARKAFRALERGRTVNKRVKNVFGYSYRDIAESIFEGGSMGLSLVSSGASDFRRMLGRLSEEEQDDLGLRVRSPRSPRRPRGKKI
jgi:hypothetical protein